MSRYTTTPPSTMRRSSGNAAMRVAIWLLALVAVAGAVFSIDRMLQDRTADEDGRTAQAVILPPSPAGQSASARQPSSGSLPSGTQNQNPAGQNLTETVQTV